ncbi:MAG TPA: hypothetical protein VF158_06700 [Longimicrobiales bacterium]
MERTTPIWAFILALLGGVAAMFALSDYPVLALFAALALLTGVFGAIWPGSSWRWGLWTSGPLVLTIVASVAFEGSPRPVDGLVLIGAPLFAGTGGYVGAQRAARRTAADV